MESLRAGEIRLTAYWNTESTAITLSLGKRKDAEFYTLSVQYESLSRVEELKKGKKKGSQGRAVQRALIRCACVLFRPTLLCTKIPVSTHNPFVAREFSEAHRPPGMKLVRTDADLCSKTEHTAVTQPC